MSILVVIGRIYLYKFKSNIWKTKIFLLIFYCIFGIYITFWTFLKKKKKIESHSLSVSEVIDSERRAYLNA